MDYSSFVEDALKASMSKISAVNDRIKDTIPYTTIDGRFDDKSNNKEINWWTNGFYGGILWLMYHETGDEKYLKNAKSIADKLEKCFDLFYNIDHDCGFLWLPTDVADYKETKNPVARKRGLHAANLMAGRFNPVGNYIRAWNDGVGKENGPTSNVGWCIIDCLMNLPLLYWASEETCDPRYKHIAMKHADMAIKNFLREDGSVNHIVEINPNTGEFVQSFGGQGYGLGSSWTRGQGWALYGFTLSYIHTKEQRYLDAAKKVAHYFINSIPESGLIPVDFRQPATPLYEDSTAACIASCGLIELSKILNDSEGEEFLEAAVNMLKTLTEKRCDFTLDQDNIVNYCTASYHADDHHFAIIYGDYYYLEALLKLKGDELFIW